MQSAYIVRHSNTASFSYWRAGWVATIWSDSCNAVRTTRDDGLGTLIRCILTGGISAGSFRCSHSLNIRERNQASQTVRDRKDKELKDPKRMMTPQQDGNADAANTALKCTHELSRAFSHTTATCSRRVRNVEGTIYGPGRAPESS